MRLNGSYNGSFVLDRLAIGTIMLAVVVVVSLPASLLAQNRGRERADVSLIDQSLVTDWRLDRLVSGKGEDEVFEPADEQTIRSLEIERETEALSDDAHELTFRYTNRGDKQLFLRSSAVLRVPYDEYRWWNGYLNDNKLQFDPDDVSLSTWFPANAALGEETGVSLGINPMHVYSRVETGRMEMDGGEALQVGIPFVLDPGETFELSYVVAAFRSRYGHRDVVQTYYDLFPQAYRPAEGIHPSVLSAPSTYLFWRPRNYRDGEHVEDLIRRYSGGHGGWEWCYAPFMRGGDWATTYQWTEGWRGYDRDRIDRHNQRVREHMARGEALDVAPMYYVNLLDAEHELVEEHFADAIEVDEPRRRRPWGQETISRIYPGPNAYGELFAESLRRIAEDYPGSRGIAWDSVFGHQSIGENVAGVKETPRRSFRKGEVFALQAAAYTELLDLNRSLKSEGYRRANAVNLKLPSPYSIGARTDAALYEGAPMNRPERLMRIESMRARLGTGKPIAWHKHLLPEYIGWIDWEVMSAEEIRRAFAQVHLDMLLLSYYWGATPTPSPGTPALGIERTMQAVPELISLSKQGWQPSAAVDAPDDIMTARFGRGVGARLVLINPNYEDRDVSLLLPSEYWNNQKLLLTREDGQSLRYKLTQDGAAVALELPARDVVLLRVAGAAEGTQIDDQSINIHTRHRAAADGSRQWTFEIQTFSEFKWDTRFYWNERTSRTTLRVEEGEQEPTFERGEEIAIKLDTTYWPGDVQALNIKTNRVRMTQQPRVHVQADASKLESLTLVPQSSEGDDKGGLAIAAPSDSPAPVQQAVEHLRDWFQFYTHHQLDDLYEPAVQDSVADNDTASIRFILGDDAELEPWQDAALRLVDDRIIELHARDEAGLHDGVLALLGEMDKVYPYLGRLNAHPRQKDEYLDKAGLTDGVLKHQPQTEPAAHPTLLEAMRNVDLME